VRLPHNLVSKKGYRGINVFLLAFAPYDSPYWLTFNQCRKLGGKVKKGEKSRLVVFWKIYDKEVEVNGENELQKRYILRYYNVFNTEQCEDLDLSKVENEVDQIEFNPIEACEEIVANMQNCPTIKTGSNASYNRASDEVTMPKKESFESEEEYYSTLFHELAHSTQHLGRLDRDKNKEDHAYSKEELVAEMTSAMLCGVAGIENKTIDNSAAYVRNWSKKFKDNEKMVVEAAQKAQKAADYILNVNNS
jgi:antirestriction protein ArdC